MLPLAIAIGAGAGALFKGLKGLSEQRQADEDNRTATWKTLASGYNPKLGAGNLRATGSPWLDALEGALAGGTQGASLGQSIGAADAANAALKGAAPSPGGVVSGGASALPVGATKTSLSSTEESPDGSTQLGPIDRLEYKKGSWKKAFDSPKVTNQPLVFAVPFNQE